MTPTLEALRDLRERVKEATEGSRELDAAVAVAFGWPDALPYGGTDFWRQNEEMPWRWFHATNRRGAECPAYTTRDYDLTAVMGLMKEGWETAIYLGGENVCVQMETEHMRRLSGFYPLEAIKPTPALALLAAVIEAWIYEIEQGDGAKPLPATRNAE